MFLLVIYDISNDSIRSKVANACEDYGLDRIQYSAFQCQLKRTHQEELMLEIEQLLGDACGQITMFPICESDWQRRIMVERNHVV